MAMHLGRAIARAYRALSRSLGTEGSPQYVLIGDVRNKATKRQLSFYCGPLACDRRLIIPSAIPMATASCRFAAANLLRMLSK
jgi:hypothetical protein